MSIDCNYYLSCWRWGFYFQRINDKKKVTQKCETSQSKHKKNEDE
jgi:hypothetical protein